MYLYKVQLTLYPKSVHFFVGMYIINKFNDIQGWMMRKYIFVALLICSALSHADAEEDAYSALEDYVNTLKAGDRGDYGAQCAAVVQSHEGSARTLIELFQSAQLYMRADPGGASMRMQQVEQQAKMRLSMLENMGCYE